MEEADLATDWQATSFLAMNKGGPGQCVLQCMLKPPWSMAWLARGVHACVQNSKVHACTPLLLLARLL